MAYNYTKSGDHGQNINRMLISEIRTVVTSYKKNLHQANTVINQYLDTYRTFTTKTDWNMTPQLYARSIYCDDT